MKKQHYFILSALLLFNYLSVQAYNLRQISSKEGLSNSAIITLFKDSEGYMWFGSCDGLNMFDGLNIETYGSNNQNLSGNIIASITEAEPGILWVETNYGLNRFDKKKNTIEYYNQFKGSYKVTKTKDNTIFVMSNDNKLYYYNSLEKLFSEVQMVLPINYNQLLNFFADENDRIWFVLNNEEIINIKVTFNKNDNTAKADDVNNINHDKRILYAFNEKSRVYFVDETHVLYELNTSTLAKTYVKDISNEIKASDNILAIIKDNDDYWIGFETNGLIKLKYTPSFESKYETERIDINCGVFSLLKDKDQPLIWIGTDGRGVYMYYNSPFSLKSFLLKELKIEKPVRALFVDKENSLWVGTKGDGMLRFPDFRIDGELNNKKVDYFNAANSQLLNDNVYSFAPSSRDIMWIGGDGPNINYYSFKDKKIHKLSYPGNKIKYIHAIHELNDSTLWASTVGTGFLKITIAGSNDHPRIVDVKQYLTDENDRTQNYFFSIMAENDSVIWFGNRGYGAYRLDINSQKMETFKFGRDKVQTSNDILCFHKDADNIWFGTSYGIYKKRLSKKIEPIYEFHNFPNNTIHGILEDSHQKLWLSTNRGIIEFNPKEETFNTYLNETEVIEFSDGAYFKDEKTGIMYFGGTDGFVSIKEDITSVKDNFVPPILFNGLKIFNDNVNLSEYIKKGNKDKNDMLVLNSKENSFTLSFIALDYINNMNHTYQYKLEPFSNEWLNNGSMNFITMSNLAPGEYHLQVRYNNKDMHKTDKSYSLIIKILPPWYLSTTAYVIYTLLIMLALFLAVKTILRNHEKNKNALLTKWEQQQKEEVYESKLRFFINITHDLCTPLTLINGPCDKIMQYEKSDDFIKKYTSLIKQNANRLNDLIQDLIEFRRIDTGNKKCNIQLLNIAEISKDITGSFYDLSDTKMIDSKINIDTPLEWTSDKGCFTAILTNLMSNAFKYTPDNGEIIINISIKDNNLELTVTNSGKGIQPEDIPLIFDRYSVLDNVEKQSKKGISARNGLGLAICFNTVKLLNGELTVNSEPNQFTEFKVTLPHLEITSPEKTATAMEEEIISPAKTEQVFKIEQYTFEESRNTIMVIDDDTEMLWFISEIFSDKYNVIPISESTEVLEILAQIQPDLIISDVMMPGIDGASLAKEIKSGKQTAHIPIILLSAKQDMVDQIKGIESGAEQYITKPFDIEYLKIVVEKLFLRKEEFKNYLNSSFSSYELSNGKFMHKEDREFMKNLIEVIDNNITNIDLSPEFIAQTLGLSIRHFYRKVKEISDTTPADIIKDYKINMAEQMLVKTNDSIDEIIFKSGFSSKSTFFRLFMEKYGCTPKQYRKQKVDDIN